MAMTIEELKKLGLSEEQQTALASVLAENAQHAAQDAKRAEEDRATRVKTRIGELRTMGFAEDKGFSGFLRVVEERLMADDGEPALVLSEHGRPKGETFSESLDAIIATFPVDKEGKLAMKLSGQHFQGAEGTPPPDDDGTEEDQRTAAEKADEFRKAAGIQTHLIGKH